MGRYKTSVHLLNAGVISGYDITTESAITKLMFLLGHSSDPEAIKTQMSRSFCGEVSVD